ncbi:hypothetical protein BHAOGJBA_0621 [Methylobacterium hispanicum]|uniref:Uncharacterized protein n=1 Tax=Methylobacterium hispanicum TaxID=270350 RepID=A0AAV4ZG89_9HYPH|nr:hypothetical protein [Methylobacterium hispanicum]GJD87121.1 hypothetical protein BHAOGJBA_0621 [Methylobacterium hispanicum]
MTPVAAVLALACYAAAPAPLVGADVHRALRGESVAAAPARQAVADAARGATVLHRKPRHGR